MDDCNCTDKCGKWEEALHKTMLDYKQLVLVEPQEKKRKVSTNNNNNNVTDVYPIISNNNDVNTVNITNNTINTNNVKIYPFIHCMYKSNDCNKKYKYRKYMDIEVIRPVYKRNLPP